MLIKRAYTIAQFERMIGQTGFRRIEIQESLIGLEICWRKKQSPNYMLAMLAYLC